MANSDTLTSLAATAQSINVDSLEEARAQAIDTSMALPQIADTAITKPLVLLPARQDRTVARTDSTGKTPSTEPAAETLPQSLSEEARSAEENVLRRLEGLTSMFSVPKIILTLLVILSTFFITRAVTIFLTRITRRRARLAPKVRTAIPLFSFGLWFVAAYFIVVGIFARSPLALVIIMGVLVLAFSFAARRLLQDLVGGLVILFERPFKIGDRIRVGTQYGEVAKIGLRAFRLLAFDGSLVTVPNAEIMHVSISNTNSGKTESLVVTELLLPSDIDVAAAAQIAFEAAQVSPYVYMKKPIEVQIDEEYKDALLTKLVIKAYVFDARYENDLRNHIITQARKGLQHQV